MFLLGLLMPIYTITGYDASAHTSEETLKAAHSVPTGMVMSVVWAGRVRLRSYSAQFVLMIPNMDEAAKQGWNVFFWAMDSQVNPAVKVILYLAIFVAQFLCGLATVTSVSRMIFAFSRDGGLPAGAPGPCRASARNTARRWRRSGPGACSLVLFVWGSSLVSIGETPVYTIVVSCTVIFLFFSFVIPIALGLVAYGTSRKWTEDGTPGPWGGRSSRCSPCSRSSRWC